MNTPSDFAVTPQNVVGSMAQTLAPSQEYDNFSQVAMQATPLAPFALSSSNNHGNHNRAFAATTPSGPQDAYNDWSPASSQFSPGDWRRTPGIPGFYGHPYRRDSNGAQEGANPQQPRHHSSQDLAAQHFGSNGHPLNRYEPSKNLIGQTHSSLQKLTGLDEHAGLFFVFQDLSVRTEGWFRLKTSLYLIGHVGLEGEDQIDAEVRDGLLVEAPCLAKAFTKPFKVFSAKKFPGVWPSTDLSEKFAEQGIKIPIRRNDGKRRRGQNGDDEYDDDD
jgi:hypothetical protein